ncbi:MAG: hypothetical protein GXP09_10305 [Gammaproteobacteria bacterium]|nr:hypothetical protein [Gammaproteobacteria bacterium]
MPETRTSEKHERRYYRVQFIVELVCKTDVHVGDGREAVKIEAERCKIYGSERDIASKENLKENGTYQCCYTRPSERLVLPGSTLRGFLRRGLTRNNDCRKELFGPDDIGSGEHRGGCVRVMDARYDGCDPTLVSYWHPDRMTGLRSGIKIRPETGTQDGKGLFYHEVYPQGARFTAELEMDWVDESEIDGLIEALKRWDGDLTHGLGAKKTKSWGVLEVEKCSYRSISTDAIHNWFVKDNDKRDIDVLFGDSVDVSIASIEKQLLDVPLTLITQQPVLVHDPGQAPKKRKGNHEKEDQGLPDLVCYRNADQKATLPPESLTGALRDIATRIAATLINNRIDDPNKAVEEANPLVSKIFGDTNQASRVQWKAPVYKGDDVHTQFFIAIDRFTGGVKDGALYCACAIPPGSKLEGGGLILHKKDKWEDWQCGLLYLALREITDGHFWVGWGKAKGYGLLKLVEKDEKGKKIDLATVISNGFGPEVANNPSEWVEALKQTIDEDYKNSKQEATKKTTADDCGGEPEHKIPSVVEDGTPTINRANGKQLNPYAFVPVKALWNDGNCPAYDDIKEKGIRHDLYIPERHTGIIACTLTTVTDTLVGNEHEQPDKEKETTVHAYRHAGYVAFPANSLRGMIGNVIETLSQSSLRVLENRYFSVRKSQNERLTRKGVLIKNGEQWQIQAEGEANDLDVPPDVIATYENILKTPGIIEKPAMEKLVGKTIFYKTDNAIVSEISPSSIWRKPFYYLTSHDAFNFVSKALLPWGSIKRGVDWLTPAEVLLGVVEEDTSNAPGKQRNLASRLRFTDAKFIDNNNDPERREQVTIKILSSPEPPSEYLYFHKEGSHLVPNGRKEYLRQCPDDVSPNSYATLDIGNNKGQKTKCQPIVRNQAFTFAIHYYNLNDHEMKLLLTAIAPGGEFLHKLGLGKPLGLGSVRVEVKCIKERNIKDCFTQENGVAMEDKSISDFISDPNDLGRLVDPGTLRCLQEIGKQRDENELITYPLTKAQRYALYSNDPLIRAWSERELFAWHVVNNKLPNPEKLYSDGCVPSYFSFHQGRGGANIGWLSFDSTEEKWKIGGKEKELTGKAKEFVRDKDATLNIEVLYIEVKKRITLIQPISEIDSPD